MNEEQEYGQHDVLYALIDGMSQDTQANRSLRNDDGWMKRRQAISQEVLLSLELESAQLGKSHIFLVQNNSMGDFRR